MNYCIAKIVDKDKFVDVCKTMAKLAINKGCGVIEMLVSENSACVTVCELVAKRDSRLHPCITHMHRFEISEIDNVFLFTMSPQEIEEIVSNNDIDAIEFAFTNLDCSVSFISDNETVYTTRNASVNELHV